MKDLSKYYEYESKLLIKYNYRRGWQNLATEKEIEHLKELIDNAPEKIRKESNLISQKSKKELKQIKKYHQKDILSTEENQNYHRKVVLYE